LLPRNERFAGVLCDSCFEIAQVFEIFNAFLKSNHGLIERLDLFENGNFNNTLSFDLLQHKPEWLLPPERRNTVRANAEPIPIAFVSEFQHVAAEIVTHCFHSLPNVATHFLRQRPQLLASFLADLKSISHYRHSFASVVC